MEGERGYTLIEVVVAVAIAALLLAAGGVWLLGMRPGALPQAAHDFDADLNAARALASSTGNGATIAFLPRSGHDGFQLRVYRGRPTAADAVRASNVMPLISDASVREATFGSPPFALFFSSAGAPSGIAAYPTVRADGSVRFAPIAAQPPCPPGGTIVLTFGNAQGAHASRTLRCDALVIANAQPNATPTPNPPRLSPARAVAHWTRDAYPLQFTAAEYGYTHWYASLSGASCVTQGSDTGAAPAVFPGGWPYVAAGPNEPADPPPPNAPYTYPDLRIPDDPPAHFALQPVFGNGGLCALQIADAYGQALTAQIQVMGDLTPSETALTFASVRAPAQHVSLTKTWDSEPIALAYGGSCAKIATIAQHDAATPSSPGSTPARVDLTVTPTAAGACVMQFSDQYHEPWASIAVNVKQDAPFKTWPAKLVLGASGGSVGAASGTQLAMTPQANMAKILNALLGGGVALAAGGYTGPCYAQAENTSGSGPDTNITAVTLNALGITVDTGGCLLNAAGSAPYGESSPGIGTPTGVMVAYEPGGQPGTFSAPNQCTNIGTGSWYPANATGVQVSLSATGTAQGSCTIDFSDGASMQTPAPDAGQVAVNVVPPACINGGHIPEGITCSGSFSLPPGGGFCNVQVAFALGWEDGSWSIGASPSGLGNLVDRSNGSFQFTFFAPGTVTITLTGRKAVADPGIYLCRDGSAIAGTMMLASP